MKALEQFTIRQSDFAEKHKLKPGEVKALREKHLVEGEDWTTKVRAILWTPEAAEKVKSFLVPSPIYAVLVEAAKQAAASLLTALVLKPCRNKRWVYAALGEERISVRVGNTRYKKLNRKKIPVRKIEGTEDYEYTP